MPGRVGPRQRFVVANNHATAEAFAQALGAVGVDASPCDEIGWIRGGATVIVVADSTSPDSSALRSFTRIEGPRAPSLVVVGVSDDPKSIWGWFGVGASAVLMTSDALSEVASAVRIVEAGGKWIPSEV